MSLEELLEAWRVHDGVNLELLALCPDEVLDLKPGKGKTIRSNFVHIVGMRRAYVEERMKAEVEAIPKLDWKTASRGEIIAALGVSSRLMEELFKLLETKPGRWTAPKFFGYVVAHEANHRSQVEISLRVGGFEPPVAALYRLWDWSRK